MKNGVVIIGAGHAGVQAAASLREDGYDGKVTLVGDERDPGVEEVEALGGRRLLATTGDLGDGLHAERGHLDATQTSAAAQQVQDAANFMFANCKLTPEPDAALHGLLAALLSGATAIKANPADTSPVASMRETMALYPRMFEDATWQADTAPAE